MPCLDFTEKVKVTLLCITTRLLCPWDLPGKTTGAGCLFLLQGIFLTQGSNPGLCIAGRFLVSSALSSENLKIPDINLGVRLHASFLRGMIFQTQAWMYPGAPLCSFLSTLSSPLPYGFCFSSPWRAPECSEEAADILESLYGPQLPHLGIKEVGSHDSEVVFLFQ